MRRLILSLAVVACSAVSASSRPPDSLDWTEFHNSRFGLHLQYPSAVFSAQRSSEAGDGDLFTTSDNSAKLLVGAFENSDHHSPASYQRFILQQSYPGLRVDYSPVGQTWSVLSGTRGDTMVYEKVMFSCGGRVINSFAIVYPIAERAFYDPIVEVVEDSFSPGIESCGQHASRD